MTHPMSEPWVDWKEMDSAPKNGEPVILYLPINTPDRRILTCYWTDAGWWICSGSIVLGKPARWASLPDAPIL